jgi:endoglucanase
MYGFETEHSSLACDWVSTYDEMLNNVERLGFNTIRLPFSHDYLHNTDMTAMDTFFKAVLKTHLDVVLDFHRIVNFQQSPKPYDDQHPFEMFVNDWLFILDRYKGNSHLIGLDLFNEWQDGDMTEWNKLASIAINSIENKFPYRFFYMVGGVEWGSNSHDIHIDLPYQDRIFHTIHRYVWSNGDSSSWDYTFGDIGNGTKMIVGEYGAKSDLPNQMEWFKSFLDYLKGRNIRNSFFWTYAVSGDTGGLYKDNCLDVEWDKVYLLWKFWDYKPPMLRKGGECRFVGWSGCVGN